MTSRYALVTGVALLAVAGLGAATGPVASSRAVVARTALTASKIWELSKGCAQSSAEVENAVSPKNGEVFAEWMGCRGSGIAIAHSTDGGRTYFAASLLPATAHASTWDPAITVAADGTLYASYMTQVGSDAYPVVDISKADGTGPWHISKLLPPKSHNWGDRDFIATGNGGTVYVTWDYGPSASKMRLVCPPNGSCAFSYGDLNIVVQKSTNWGTTWGHLVHVSPNYPAGGADAGPLVVEPNGDIDCAYQALATDPRTYKLSPGHMYFTRSTDGGQKWSAPVRLGPHRGTESVDEWWIDGAIALDRGGDLYATWDTQGRRQDIGWLTYSTDHGRTWSSAIRVTPDHDTAPHVVQVAAGRKGVAVVGWLSDHSSTGYHLYVRPLSVAKGWIAPISAVSAQVHGSPRVWPGDTFGISMLAPSLVSPSEEVALDWGSTPSMTSKLDQMWGRLVGLPT
jgi:hypothetical protein